MKRALFRKYISFVMVMAIFTISISGFCRPGIAATPPSAAEFHVDKHDCDQHGKDSRVCPHCGNTRSWAIRAATARDGLYQCRVCHLQFTVTTKTPLHSTKLPLWKWLLAMYLMSSSSKGISSVVLAKLVGRTQKAAWKVGHAIRVLMALVSAEAPLLQGTVELDEKFLGGSPRFQEGVKHKRGKGTSKQCIAVAVEREGSVRATLVAHDGETALRHFVEAAVNPAAYLMSDHNPAYVKIAEGFAGHSFVNHGERKYVRDEVHNNTAESFNSILERAKVGVFHYLSKEHMQRYDDEMAFRWNQRVAEERISKSCRKRTVMKSLPVINKVANLLRYAFNVQIRWTCYGSIRAIA
jgi:transposase-like protein